MPKIIVTAWLTTGQIEITPFDDATKARDYFTGLRTDPLVESVMIEASDEPDLETVLGDAQADEVDHLAATYVN